jgi:hypothetical protein
VENDMKTRHLIFATLTIIMLILTPSVQGQDDAMTLFANTVMEGQIAAAGEEVVWTFYALREDVFSFHVQAVDDNLDPVISLRFGGTEVITNDDVAYPDDQNALLEAITIPRTGVYEVVVSGFNDSTGNYTLTMLPGYATIAVDERFATFGNWRVTNIPNATIDNGALVATQSGIRERGWLEDAGHIHPLGDFYASLIVREVTGNNGWRVGLSFRRRATGDGYLVLVNAAGWWRFVATEGGEDRIIRDWMPHPVIIPNDPDFSLSVLANGDCFEIFYNGQLLGRASDDAFSEPGDIGIIVETPDALESEMTAALDDLLVTIPVELNGAALLPQAIIDTDQAIITHEMERHHLIPGGGQLTWNVGESFARKDDPGVGRVYLSQDTLYRNFILGTTFSMETTIVENDAAGCGLLLRNTGESEYTIAYLDNTGAAGVSQRTGDTFLPGIYFEGGNTLFQPENTLVVVVNETLLRYYVNGQSIGALAIGPVEGEVGNIVLAFDPVGVACQFSNTWLWTWGE